MIRLLPYAIQLVLVIFCLIDCLQADANRVRNLPRWAWVALILLLPVVGAIAWLFAGRPRRTSVANPQRQPGPPPGFPQYERPRPKAPDDDPDFLRSLRQRKADEDLLKKWEDDLRRREEELRKDEEKGTGEA